MASYSPSFSPKLLVTVLVIGDNNTPFNAIQRNKSIFGVYRIRNVKNKKSSENHSF